MSTAVVCTASRFVLLAAPVPEELGFDLFVARLGPWAATELRDAGLTVALAGTSYTCSSARRKEIGRVDEKLSAANTTIPTSPNQAGFAIKRTIVIDLCPATVVRPADATFLEWSSFKTVCHADEKRNLLENPLQRVQGESASKSAKQNENNR